MADHGERIARLEVQVDMHETRINSHAVEISETRIFKARIIAFASLAAAFGAGAGPKIWEVLGRMLGMN